MNFSDSVYDLLQKNLFKKMSEVKNLVSPLILDLDLDYTITGTILFFISDLSRKNDK